MQIVGVALFTEWAGLISDQEGVGHFLVTLAAYVQCYNT